MEKIEDEEEQNRMLKACHQRCANRTLKVLEKNGSIFIKLGQHLVHWSDCWVLKGVADYHAERYELPSTNRMDFYFHTSPGQMPSFVL
jgi:hypothetical protein